jgi:uncharacterized heparinase superfamily protein
MITNELLRKIHRGLKKPPKVIIKRLGHELRGYTDKYIAPQRARQLTLSRLLKKTRAPSLDQLWQTLSARPYFAVTGQVDKVQFEQLCPGDTEIILKRAQLAIEHRVDLLGSGLIPLGKAIEWQKDYKSKFDWPLIYMRDIEYNNPERPSDVKFPWELSRLQWLIPTGQAYLLTKNEKYATAAKNILESWIDSNPYTFGVNWACTMEVALRIISWTWFFHVFNASQAWQDKKFQQKFLTSLFLHGDFTERHLEFSDVNGNHYTADAAGLVFAGLFFGEGEAPKRWHKTGWKILCHELPRQVFADGVDFEASVPYHRLVLELFFLPACYREALHFDTPPDYSDRLRLMAEFTAAYTQPGGTAPFWGDADDARTLPLGYQPLNDHRYLCGLVGMQWDAPALLAQNTGSLGELFWIYGPESLEHIVKEAKVTQPTSCAFPEGGFYIMRNETDHIFIDCGPLGLAGRGGHGHNDCLSMEVVLDGIKLISDCGAYVYTASYKDRNLFRSTQYHNTPCIDDQEINRFIRWDYLWTLHNDAQPIVEAWQPGIEQDYFCGTHTGYQRLADPVTPRRSITLEHQSHRLIILDDIVCTDKHTVHIPLHLTPDILTERISNNSLLLKSETKKFQLTWHGDSPWQIQQKPSRISPSYGVARASQQLVWQAEIIGNSQLKIVIEPYGD